MDIEELLSKLTLNEKSLLIAGTNFMYTYAIKDLKIPSIRMSDGPHGLRVQNGEGDNGVNGSEVATCFPTASIACCSFDRDMMYKIGSSIANEAKYYGINMVLGPGINIKRNPRGGRNFEYFSEDPLLASEMAVMEVKGLQDNNVASCIKHFALNNSENYRFLSDSICDEKAMNEIYLKVFERTIKKSKPAAVMCAYNKINGTYCCENKWLLTDILRNAWHYEGMVLTDWGAMHDRVEALRAGLDLEMPGDTAYCRKMVIDKINNGSLDEKYLNDAVKNILKVVDKYSKQKKVPADFEKNHEIAIEAACKSAVLMKNEKNILPLKSQEKLLIIGEMFSQMRYQGSGSSMINPYKLVTPETSFNNHLIQYDFCQGYDVNSEEIDYKLEEEAITKSNDFDKVILFAGLTDFTESEGCDRENISLPHNQEVLIEKLAEKGKKIILVLFGGSVVTLPFEKCAAVLYMGLPGQGGGEAVYKLLFGEISPSGRLAETWIKDYNDLPYPVFSVNEQEAYKESIFVGYRYYVSKGVKVNFPFGYGLSYTDFQYNNFKVYAKSNHLEVEAEVKNIGEMKGEEVIQIYVEGAKNNLFRPKRELKAFTKISLNPGESKNVKLIIDYEDLKIYSLTDKRFIFPNGEYVISINKDAETVIDSNVVELGYDKINNGNLALLKPYLNYDISAISNEIYSELFNLNIPVLRNKNHMYIDSRFTDMKRTFLGRILFNTVLSVADKQKKTALKMPKGEERNNRLKGAIFLRRILESNTLISMSMSSGKTFPYNFAEAFMYIANGNLIKGIKCFCKKIQISELPKDKEDK